MAKNKNITIDALAQMTEERIQGVEKEVREGFGFMKDSFGLVLEVLNGLRDDVKQARSASRVEYAELREKVDPLEHDVRKIKQKVKI